MACFFCLNWCNLDFASTLGGQQLRQACAELAAGVVMAKTLFQNNPFFLSREKEKPPKKKTAVLGGGLPTNDSQAIDGRRRENRLGVRRKRRERLRAVPLPPESWVAQLGALNSLPLFWGGGFSPTKIDQTKKQKKHRYQLIDYIKKKKKKHIGTNLFYPLYWRT